VADELGMDPIEVRRKNFIPPDKFPYKTPCGPTYDSGEYDKALTRALEISNYAALREEQKRRLTEDDGRKTNGGEPSSSVLGPWRFGVVRHGGGLLCESGRGPPHRGAGCWGPTRPPRSRFPGPFRPRAGGVPPPPPRSPPRRGGGLSKRP